MAKGKFFPRRPRDRALFLFMVIGIPFTLWFEVSIVFPFYYPTYSRWIPVHICLGLYIAINALANMYYVITKDSSTRLLLGVTSHMMVAGREGWRMCDTCQLPAPPRSYHCPHCDECILKRDHHCMFTGCCVGYHNHRYFLVALLYLCVGSLYGHLYTLPYFIHHLGGYHLTTYLTMVAPHIAVLFGGLPPSSLCLCVLWMLGVVVVGATSWLLLYHLHLIRRGQTMYEAKHGLHTYSTHTTTHNFISVLGTRYYWVWLWPALPSPLPGLGVYQAHTSTSSQEDKKSL